MSPGPASSSFILFTAQQVRSFDRRERRPYIVGVIGTEENMTGVSGPEGEPLVSVVIPAMNAASTLGATLAGLERQDLDDRYEVIVVDDSSDDETASVAASGSMPVNVIRQARSGAAKARNRGAAAARADVIAFLDADCVPDPPWLREGMDALEEADLVQGQVVADPSVSRGPFDRTLWVTHASPLYESANIFVRRELFDELGGFVDLLRVSGRPLGEDAWFGWRARRSGARTSFASDASVSHAVFPRGPRGYVAERLRARYFPGIVRRIPELRREFLFAWVFLSRRSAMFDAAVAALLLAAVWTTPIALLGALPYVTWLTRRALPHRRDAALVGVAELFADAVTLGALLFGTVRWRRAVI